LSNIAARFGGFPSGLDDVGLYPMLSHHMGPLFTAIHYRSPELLVDVIQSLCTYDVLTMEDDDFRYLLALVDRVSYTEDSRVINWRCLAPRWVKGVEGTAGFDYTPVNPHNPKYRKTVCDSLNTQDVRFTVKVVGERRKLPANMKHPLISSLEPAYSAIKNGYPEDLIMAARWVDCDWPLEAIADSLTCEELATIKRHMYSRIVVQQKLRCAFCPNEVLNVDPLDMFGFLRVFSDVSMMNMQFNLSMHFNACIPEDIPLKRLLYHHGCYVQDRREAERKKREAAAAAHRS
jgi:hypothetical protein